MTKVRAFVGALAATGIALVLSAVPAFAGAFPGVNGPVVFVSYRHDGQPDIYKTDGTGSLAVALTTDNGQDLYPAINADSTKVAFASDRDGGLFQIYTMGIDGSAQTNRSNDGCDETQPSWSTDGTKIAFVSKCGAGFSQIVVMNADGTGRVTLSDGTADDQQPAWSPDGAKIAFSSQRTGRPQIFVMNANGTGVVNLSSNAFNETKPNWKSDGTKLAYQTDRLGLAQVWGMDANGANQVALLTTNPAGTGKRDTNPAYSPDGTKIVFTRPVTGSSTEVEAMSMNVGGGGLTDLSNSVSADDQPDWGPQAPGPDVPEVPLAILLPGTALLVGAVGYAATRRRRSLGGLPI